MSETFFGGVMPVGSQDESDYDADVSTIIEHGARGGGVVSAWSEVRDDAYLLYSKPKVSLEEIISMRRTDGMARALGNLVTLPIKLALQQGKWVAPEGGDAEEEVEFANLMWNTPPALGGMTTPKSQVYDQILLSVFDGFAPFELVSHVPTFGPLKGKKTIRKIAYRDPRTVTLLQDRRGGYAGFRQQVYIPGSNRSDVKNELLDISLSPAKTVLFTVNGHENPLYGVSYFESAYPHYKSKMKWYYISEMAGQFAAVPGRIGTIPRNAKVADVMAFRQALENFYFNTTMIMKEGYKVDPFNTSSGFQFLPHIEHHNLMMSKSVLASFMESEQRTVLVENSTEDASADLFLLSMETLAEEFASILTNHVMPKYIKENFKNSTKFPVFKPGPLSDNARRKIASLFEKVAVSGILNTTPEMVRELEKHVARDLGLDVDYDEIEAREEEAAIQQAEQAEMLAAQAQQESLDQERAAEGGVPGSPTPTTAGPVSSQSTRTSPGEEGQVPKEANSGVSLSELETSLSATHDDMLDSLVVAAQRLLAEFPLEDHPVEEGLSS